VDGGGSQNDFLMQFQADILNSYVVRSTVEELSAQRAAMAAMLALNWYSDLAELQAIRKTDPPFVCVMPDKVRHALYTGWQTALKRATIV
jgi:glycerol kinase